MTCSRLFCSGQPEAFWAQRDARPHHQAFAAFAASFAASEDCRRFAGMVRCWQWRSICIVPGMSILHSVIPVGGACMPSQVAQDFCLVSQRSRRVIPLYVGSGCHRRVCRASKARIRLGFLLASVCQAADSPSLLVARHLHSLGVGHKPFSRQLRRLGLDVERHWSVHDCEFFLCALTRIKRRTMAFLEGCPVGWGGIPTGAGLVEGGGWGKC